VLPPEQRLRDDRPVSEWVDALEAALRDCTDTPPSTYRLIAGMYNPLTGERLPVLDDNGNLLTDAILVAELSLP